METVTGFIIMLLGVFLTALVFVLAFHLLKRRRIKRIQDPHKDHYKR